MTHEVGTFARGVIWVLPVLPSNTIVQGIFCKLDHTFPCEIMP